MGLRSRSPHGSKPDYPHFADKPPTTFKGNPSQSKPRESSECSVLDTWKASRATTNGGNTPLPAGSARPLTWQNIRLALCMIRVSVYNILRLFFSLHPYRIILLLFINVIRGLLPAFRSYSHALILDEIQHIVTSGNLDFTRLISLCSSDVARMLAETLFDSFATHNEDVIHQSVRFRIEYLQMQTRLRLDIPSLSDPTIRDLLQEADLFVQSFTGLGGFGLFSPLDLVNGLTTFSQLISQAYVLYTMSRQSFTHAHTIALISVVFPTIMSFANSLICPLDSWSSAPFGAEEAKTAERHEQMRYMAYNDHFKPEITLFGLADWILETWASTRRTLLGMKDQPSSSISSATREFVQSSAREMSTMLRNVPLALQFTSASLGSVTTYRTAAETLVMTLSGISRSFRGTYHSIFLTAAFHAASELQSSLEPNPSDRVAYQTAVTKDGRRGMKIEARNLGFTYPGQARSALRNVNIRIEPGEVIAICGFNGGGKSTLMNILMRLYDFDSGELLINGVDVRKYKPSDLHDRTTALFQNFSKYNNASVRENTGLGQVSAMFLDDAVKKALETAGAHKIVERLPSGLETRLNSGGGDFFFPNKIQQGPLRAPSPFGESGDVEEVGRAALSGGEWQRIAISRAFMREETSDLWIVDETAALDPQAETDFFRKLLGRGRVKTVIYITHRLNTVHFADKVAMVENGTITEFGKHDELMRRGGSYASLYKTFSQSSS